MLRDEARTEPIEGESMLLVGLRPTDEDSSDLISCWVETEKVHYSARKCFIYIRARLSRVRLLQLAIAMSAESSQETSGSPPTGFKFSEDSICSTCAI